MTLAHRLGLPDRTGYVPAAFAATAFALGVQIALVTEALGAQPYPPTGKSTLAWGSGLVLALSAVVHVPWGRVVERVREAAPGSGIPRRDVYLQPHEQAAASARVASHAHNGHEQPVEPDLRASVHSPLSAGPVVAPHEEVPVTIEAEPEELARELDVSITVHGPSGSRTVQRQMRGTQLEHVLSFDEHGAFTVTVELDHPRARPVAKQLEGRVASYREEVGRLFEQLKERAEREGLAVEPGSTPREVCGELRERGRAEPAELADLAIELEVALYGDEEVGRATYETVHAAIASTGLLPDGTGREVVR